ncbi:PLP-dependent aminotransferase family protein [Nocardioides sp. C4-1]|uniref:aminotransferase-like domain-containing protein n=1 Tax=Nocardioides sp. C4-1 TaxID=3151851 RepID=UPI003263A86F
MGNGPKTVRRRRRATNTTGRVTRLLAGWQSQSGPLAQRLAAAVTDLVDQGDLRAGDTMPSERTLAGALMVSRGTVTAAYNLLRDARVIESRVGSGSSVTSVGARGVAGPRADARLTSFGEHPVQRHHDLSSGAPGGLDLVREHTDRVLQHPRLAELVADDGYEPAGLLELRTALARYYADLGVATSADEVLVTSGSQQGLAMVAAALVRPGDVVLVEDPSYRGALDAFRAQGARLVPVPVDHSGPDLEVLERLVRRLEPRLFYSLPIAHNPTGSVITPDRAAGVNRILAGSRTILLEDGSPADLVLDADRPPTPVGHGLPPDQWVALGSVSKLFWGGLRIGWIRARSSFLGPLVRAKAVADLGSSPLTQLVAASCLSVVDEARVVRRRQLETGYAAASAILNAEAPEWSFTRPGGGSGLWVRVPGLDASAFGQHARRHGILVSPGPVFSAVEGCREFLRIPFWREPDALGEGLADLIALWRDH